MNLKTSDILKQEVIRTRQPPEYNCLKMDLSDCLMFVFEDSLLSFNPYPTLI